MEKLDLLGYWVPPYAYAMLQILGEAVEKVGSLDQEKIANYIHASEFKTVVGSVRFAPSGEWVQGRALYVQYRGIQGHDLEQWKQSGKAVIVWPAALKTGQLVHPYEKAHQ